MISVVYDSCVIYPPSLRDLLLHLAEARIVHAHWSNDIHEEWIRSVLDDRPDLSRQKLEKARKAMDASIRDALVTGYEHLIESLHLPDKDDRHVLAVAVHAGASRIVTNNLRDFPDVVLAPFDVKAISPDDFVMQLIGENAQAVLAVVRLQRERLKNPPKTVDEHLATLEKQRLLKTVAFLWEHRDEI